jgi:Osmosensitive K+ channel histidine kinase
MDKLETGSLTIKRRETRLNRIVERSIDSILGITEAKKIEVKPFFHGGTGHEDVVDKPVSLDEDRIVQILVNLLSNAVKFSPEGSTIKLAAWTEGAYVCFTVADNGIGISEELKSTVFEKYKQLERFNHEEQNRVKGFGLGLAICKRIVEQHQGRIWIEDTPGSCGCTFQIRLPQLD